MEDKDNYNPMPKECLSNHFGSNIDAWKDYKAKPCSMQELMDEIEKWSETYEFSFQFWGNGNNNIYLSKGGVDLYDTGGLETPREAIETVLMWIYIKNRVRIDLRPTLKMELDKV